VTLRIAVLTIGDELLNGELADGNTAVIGRMLGSEGYALRESLTVADKEQDIIEALQMLAEKRDIIIVTGGLGPTADDLTARAAAHAFGRRYMLNEQALELIREHFRRLGLDMHPSNEKQALLPHKAKILPNPRGTAPGFVLHHNGRELFFLPGVPDEMTGMLEECVLPALRERSGGSSPRQERVLTVFGLSEPKTEAVLKKQTFADEVTVGFGVDFPFVRVKLRCNKENADELLNQAELLARKALGDFIVASGKDTLAANVVRMFRSSDLTLSLAESCTGGMIAKLLTDFPGASDFLERSGVTYANTAKQDWLGVPIEILEQDGAVSENCAMAMARGIRQNAATDIGLAVTGIAGPSGGSEEKPVGTVFLALSAPGQENVKGYRFAGDRQQVRLMSACMALEWLRRYLSARLNH